MNKIYILIILTLGIHNTTLQADPLKASIEIAAHGHKAASERLKVVAENLANIDSTGSAPGADPYRRKVVVLTNKYNKILGVNTVEVKKVTTDRAPFIIKYDPYNHAADKNGFVKLPNVTREVEMVDAKLAQRSIEADLSVIEMSNALIKSTLDAIR